MASYRIAAASYAPQQMGFGSIGDFQNGANGATYGFMTPTDQVLCQARVLTDPSGVLFTSEQNDTSNVSVGGAIVDFAVAIAGVATVAAQVIVARAMATSIAGTSAVSGALRETKSLSTTVTGTGAVTAALRVTRALSTAIAGVGTVTPNLTKVKAMAASVAGTSTVSAAIIVSRRMATTVVGQAAISVALRLNHALSTVVAGASQVAASLTIQGAGPPPIVASLAMLRRRMYQRWFRRIDV